MTTPEPLMIDAEVLAELLDQAKGAEDDLSLIEQQAALWADDERAADLESLAGEARDAVKDVRRELRRLTKVLGDQS